MTQESDVTDFSDAGFPKDIEVIPLPGHFFDMVGFRIGRTDFSIFSEELLLQTKERRDCQCMLHTLI